MAGVQKLPRAGGTVLHTWNLTTADPIGDAVSIPGASDRTVQFVETNWGGATAVLEGSLDGGTTYFTLTDGPGNEISFTSDGGEMVAENVLSMRARLDVVGTAAVVQVLLLSRSTMR